MKNAKYSVEVQEYGNPIDVRKHPRSYILGVFNSKNEAENFIQEHEFPERYSEDLEGWISTDYDRTLLYKVKIVPM